MRFGRANFQADVKIDVETCNRFKEAHCLNVTSSLNIIKNEVPANNAIILWCQQFSVSTAGNVILARKKM